MKKNIVWLASYPKSGNTWLRVFLANYISNSPTPVPINEVQRFGTGDSMAPHYHMAAGRRVDTSNKDVMLALRGRVLRGIASNNADVNLVKTHNMNTIANGTVLIPNEVTRSAIYVLRNPLDMALSYAKHFGQTHEQAATAICNKKNALVGDQVFTGSFISRWADHVESWTSHKPYPVLTLRYEDMMNDPVTAFGKALDHLGLPVEPERLSRAIRHSSFEELRKQEQDQGFIESSSVSDVGFFRQGKAGHWRDELDPELAAMIRKANSRAMKRFRYYET